MKRSSQVALLLMGASSVGAGAYALTPRDCVSGAPPASAAIAPATPAAPHGAIEPGAGLPPCPPGRSAFTSTRFHSNRWSRPIFSRVATPRTTGLSSSGARTSVPSVPRSAVSSQRGGFGSTGRALSSSS